VERRKQGLKRSVVTDAGGIPLGAVHAPANRRDDGLLAATLDTTSAVGVLPERPVVHLDAGYDYQTCRQVLVERGMVGEVATPRGAGAHPGQPPVAGGAHPCMGQPVRQAALVDRAPPAGGGLLAGIGQRRDRLRPAAAACLELLPLADPTPPPALTPTSVGP